MKHKLTGNITQDIDIVFDAVSYVTQLIDGLVEEELSQDKARKNDTDSVGKNDHTKVQIHMSDLKKMMHYAEETAKSMRLAENEYRFGPLSRV